jgi:hypothetical protein
MLLVMNQFFDELGGLWVAAAKKRGAMISPPALDPRVSVELLEMARVTAHSSERRFAPLSCFLAGVAAERIRNASPGVDDGDIADYIQEVRRKLETGTSRTPADG